MDKTIKRLLTFMYFISITAGALFIIFYDGSGNSIKRIFPLLIMILYSLILMKGFSGSPGNDSLYGGINFLLPLGLLFFSLTVVSLLIHLKIKGPELTAPDAAALALSYLFMALTSSAGSLVLRYVLGRLYTDVKDGAREEDSQACQRDLYIPA